MIPIANFSVIISSNPLFYFLLLIALAGFAFYVYKHTIPVVSKGLRYFLIALRAVILGLILFLLFDPMLAVTSKSELESKTFVFIDNSNSLAVKDSAKRVEQIDNFVNDLQSAGGIKTKILTFGQRIDSVRNLKNDIRLSEHKTDFAQVVDEINKEGSKVNAAVILSDGIITDGIDPTYQAEKLQSPIFTVGIGDTTQRRDVSVSDVRYNQYVYAGKPTSIEVSVKNFGFAQKPERVIFYEEGKPIASKDLVLSEAGIDKITFDYKPSGSGEKKLSVLATPLAGEFTNANNSKTFFINVLDTKLKVCLVAGAPSADLSAIASALSIDKDLAIKKLVQIASGRFLNDTPTSVVDSADVLFLIDFPEQNTPQNLIDKIATLINEKSKPFFFLLSNGVSTGRLRSLGSNLPFSLARAGNDFVQAEPELVTQEFSPYFSGISNQKDVWQNLPPVTQMAAELQSKPGSSVLVRSKIRNVLTNNPLILLRSIGNQRSFSILAGDIWRWQLQSADKYSSFFPNFLIDIVKWLSLSNRQKQFQITTDKKTYLQNETVKLKAELYDQTFSPIDTAKITAQILFNNEKYNLVFSPDGNGLYSAEYNPNKFGDYTFSGEASLNGSKIKSGTGRFNVSELNIEKVDTRMRADFLQLLANHSNGRYYAIDDYKNLLQRLKDLNKESAKEKVTKSEFQLWSDEWVLLLIIFLFAVEWFVRKRSGMI